MIPVRLDPMIAKLVRKQGIMRRIKDLNDTRDPAFWRHHSHDGGISADSSNSE
jgi:hypothetical protein